MKRIKITVFCGLFLISTGAFSQSNPVTNDSIRLTQAYVNLTLTKEYFEELPKKRLEKMLPFLNSELKSITDEKFIADNVGLYSFTKGLWYFNSSKFKYKYNDSLNRKMVLDLHSTFKKSLQNHNIAVGSDYYRMNEDPKNPFFEMMNYDMKSFVDHWMNLTYLKMDFSSLFNEEVYREFKKMYYNAQVLKVYRFKEMEAVANMYDFLFELHILKNQNDDFVDRQDDAVIRMNEFYVMNQKSHALAQYLQLHYFVYEKELSPLITIDLDALYFNFTKFKWLVSQNNYFQNDPFFKKEINAESINKLYEDFVKRYPHDYTHMESDVQSFLNIDVDLPVKYFFPNPAPIPSAKFFLPNYQTDLETLDEVAIHLEGVFNKAGYKDKLRYYYSIDGFALLSKLERFNKDGTEVSSNKRWVNVFGDGKFSYYQIFKSLFFEVSTEFRMFALVIASKNAKIGSQIMTAQVAQELLMHGYETLPEELKKKILNPKNLSVLVYHFHQNDIGEVPELDLSGNISAENYLKTAGLSEILQN